MARLQFWPKSRHARSKIHYTGQLKIKYMIQARQFRKSHPDAHYASDLFRYQREFAVKFKSHTTFVCVDDKHRAKVGEPGFPVAAAERGRRVIVGLDSSMEVGDHDFTHFSVIPSVSFVLDIPEAVEESWYRGQVMVSVKESAFEPSSPICHCTELCNVLTSKGLDSQPMLCLYSDGGPDHRLTYLSVQLSLIGIFLTLDLDYLCACRTAPFHSWRNPVERIMSLLNLGLQSVGLMRKQMDDAYETIVSGCNSVNDIRKVAGKYPNIKEGTADSISPVKCLLSSIFQRLELKGKKVECFSSATLEEIKAMWDTLGSMDSTITADEKLVKKSLSTHTKLKEFIEHCCLQRHYSFQIKKCGQPTCDICRPPRLPPDVFDEVKYLPDPMSGTDGHYKQFQDVYGTVTSEDCRPSLQKRPTRVKTLPFVASIQHARNTNIMMQCEECEMWRIVYSKYKLTSQEKKQLNTILEDYTYTCSATLADLELTGRLADVCMRVLNCYEPLEKLYYSLNKEPLCIYCCGDSDLASAQGCYPQCSDCLQKPNISKRV